MKKHTTHAHKIIQKKNKTQIQTKHMNEKQKHIIQT